MSPQALTVSATALGTAAGEPRIEGLIPKAFPPRKKATKKLPAPKVRKLCDAPAKKSKFVAATPTELVLRYRESARKLAISMITKWKCRLEPDELQSVIDLALCEAASRYNHSHGAAFMTFLFYHLKGKLVKTIASRAKQGLLFVDDYERALFVMHGDGDTCDVQKGEWLTISADLQAPHQPEELLYRQQMMNICQKACARLRGAEKEVIRQVFFENKDLAEVTEEMGYSRGHLFRIRMRALEKVRRSVQAQCR